MAAETTGLASPGEGGDFDPEAMRQIMTDIMVADYPTLDDAALERILKDAAEEQTPTEPAPLVGGRTLYADPNYAPSPDGRDDKQELPPPTSRMSGMAVEGTSLAVHQRSQRRRLGGNGARVILSRWGGLNTRY